jgi:hypothetical protein
VKKGSGDAHFMGLPICYMEKSVRLVQGQDQSLKEKYDLENRFEHY